MKLQTPDSRQSDPVMLTLQATKKTTAKKAPAKKTTAKKATAKKTTAKKAAPKKTVRDCNSTDGCAMRRKIGRERDKRYVLTFFLTGCQEDCDEEGCP